MKIVEAFRKRKQEIQSSLGKLCVAAIDRVACKGRRIAKIFQAQSAIGASAIRSADPGYAYTRAQRELFRLACDDLAHNLMAWDQRIAQG
jgi:hypothetical protein